MQPVQNMRLDFAVYTSTQSRRNFFRRAGRLVDMKGNGQWFEVTGNSLDEANQSGKLHATSDVALASNLTMKSTIYFSGRKVMDLNLRSRTLRKAMPCSSNSLHRKVRSQTSCKRKAMNA